jgi:hypothetical protein
MLRILVLLICSAFASEKVYDGYKVYDIKPNSADDLTVLRNLDLLEGEKRSLDFLSFHNNFDVVQLMVKPEEQNYIENLFETKNLDYKVTVENVQR